MELYMFATVLTTVLLVLLIVGPFSGSSPSARKPFHVRIGDLPEGEIHIAELVTLSTVVAAITTLVATAIFSS